MMLPLPFFFNKTPELVAWFAEICFPHRSSSLLRIPAWLSPTTTSLCLPLRRTLLLVLLLQSSVPYV